jgi:TPR repeat protein
VVKVLLDAGASLECLLQKTTSASSLNSNKNKSGSGSAVWPGFPSFPLLTTAFVFFCSSTALQRSNADAQYTLGSYYYNGKGVAKDAKKAVKWYLKAAEQNHAQAQFTLGECFMKGSGVKKDEKTGLECI